MMILIMMIRVTLITQGPITALGSCVISASGHIKFQFPQLWLLILPIIGRVTMHTPTWAQIRMRETSLETTLFKTNKNEGLCWTFLASLYLGELQNIKVFNWSSMPSNCIVNLFCSCPLFSLLQATISMYNMKPSRPPALSYPTKDGSKEPSLWHSEIWMMNNNKWWTFYTSACPCSSASH